MSKQKGKIFYISTPETLLQITLILAGVFSDIDETLSKYEFERVSLLLAFICLDFQLVHIATFSHTLYISKKLFANISTYVYTLDHSQQPVEVIEPL